MSKRMLILKSSGIKDEECECENIKRLAELLSIDVTSVKVDNTQHLIEILKVNQGLDYLYLSAHGNAYDFGNDLPSTDKDLISMRWMDLATHLCNYDCLNTDSVLMLSCCESGLSTIAMTMAYMCNKISYTIGPRRSLECVDMLQAFSNILWNIERRNLDPMLACQKNEEGTLLRFLCYDRVELENSAAYMIFSESLTKAIESASKQVTLHTEEQKAA